MKSDAVKLLGLPFLLLWLAVEILATKETQ